FRSRAMSLSGPANISNEPASTGGVSSLGSKDFSKLHSRGGGVAHANPTAKVTTLTPTQNIKVNMPNIKVNTPNIKVNAPNIKVNAPNIKVNTPTVRVATPNVRTPTVTVRTPTVTVHTPTVHVPTVSDIRLKRDIVKLSRLSNGIHLYRYRYLWSDTQYVGVMAQEVSTTVPAAVMRGADGYLRVDYDRLGLELLTWKEWRARSAGRVLPPAQ